MKRTFNWIVLCIYWLVLSTNSNAFVIYEDTRLWDQDRITFYFMDGSIKQQAEVKVFTKIWERYSGIDFRFVTNRSHINEDEFYYKITFKGGVNNSHRGAMDGLMQLGQLSEDAIFRKKTILHEFGHVLGLGHEHQRKDRHEIFYNPVLVAKCSKFQKRSKAWCKDNMFETYRYKSLVKSSYDPHSIMHYRIQDIIGSEANFDNIDDLLNPPNSLSLTDKIFIASVYNPQLSRETIENMHQQDVWNQQAFESKSKRDKEANMTALQTQSCQTLKYGQQSKDGRMCSNGFMIIGQDGMSFHHPELSNCYLFEKELKQAMDSHEVCQMTYNQLLEKRRLWNSAFSQYGQCKVLLTGVKNNQDYFCEEGLSIVTLDNDMVEERTRCLYNHEQVYNEMKKNEICNFSDSEYLLFNELLAAQTQKQMSTDTCKVVNKSYETVKCPDDFNFTIISKSYSDRPISNKCFANEHQAIRAMNEIAYCSPE